MTEKTPIRGRLVGGFDRRDVITNIKRLSEERNSFMRECEELRAELQALRDEMSTERTAAETTLNEKTEQLEAELAAARTEIMAAKLRATDAEKRLEEFVIEERAKAASAIECAETRLRELREQLNK